MKRRLQFLLAGISVLLCAPLTHAQVFAPVPGVSFTKLFAGADPLPQVVPIAAVGTGFNFTVTESEATGGNWLSVDNQGCALCAAPHPIVVKANPAVTLAAGTYTGSVVVKSQSGSVSMTIPVTLTVAATGSAYLDNPPGELSFVMATGGVAPTTQSFQVRNGGAGTLSYTMAASTSDGGAWLNAATTGTTAPDVVTVNIASDKLPGGGLTAGTFVGQILLTSTTGSFTVPVSVVVGKDVLSQVNGIHYTKVFSGADPLPQTLTITSPGNGPNFTIASYTARGGDWLTVNNQSCALCASPHAIVASVNPAVTLAAGTYTAEILVVAQGGGQTITIPVNLTVAAAGSIYFDNLPGQTSFSMKTSGLNITSQDLQVRSIGGAMSWTVTASTSDGGAWLNVSQPNGSGTSTYLTVGISVPNLPSAGLVAGAFSGQLLFQSANGNVTVPISVTVGDSTFSQIPALTFTKAFGGANPLPQTITVSSLGDGPNFTTATTTGTGGDWLSINNQSCALCASPHALVVTITAPVTLAVGTYTGQVVITSQGGGTSITVPVTLFVTDGGTPYFDNLPGQMSFFMETNGTQPPAQTLQVRNAGNSVLQWALTLSTSDGGNWLTSSSLNGSAPSAVSLSVVKANLPNAGLVAGTFVGQAVFRSTNGNSVTVSVSVTVGENIFSQVNGISFVKSFAGADPLPQYIPVASLEDGPNFTVASYSARGGGWLSVNNESCALCASPHVIVASVNAPPTMAAGTYTGEILVTAQGGSATMTIPVVLTVAQTGPVFDNVQGQLSFSLQPGGASPGSQTIEVRNVGSGSLNVSATASTSDGGNWLSVSPGTGPAPSMFTIGVAANALPSQGLVAGNFTGQILFQSSEMSVTVPVSVVVAPAAFVQQPPVTFTKVFGGTNPVSQTINVASSGTSFNFTLESAAGNGGSWFTASATNCALCALPHAITITANPAATLAAGTYTGQIALVAQGGGMSSVIPVSLTIGSVSGAPTIRSTQPALPSFMGATGFGSNMYLEIYGTNLATSTRTWAGSDFNGSNAPTSLDGVSVMVNNKPAFVYYVSPGQININTPEDTATGPVQIMVKNGSATSNAVTVTRSRISPTLQTVPQFLFGGKQNIVAQRPDFSAFIGRPGSLAGVTFVAAKPGDTVTIYALGLGATNPPTQAGVVAPQNSPISLPYEVKIGGVTAQVPFAGLVAGSIGLYQLNVTIPNVSAGDQTIELIVDGVSNAQNLTIVIGSL